MLISKWSRVAISVAVLTVVCDAAGSLGQAVPTGEPAPQAVAKLIAQLRADHFRSRQQASAELEKLGDPVLPALRKAATANVELEVQRRIELVVSRIQAASVEKQLKAYCAKQGLARDKVESCKSALAPEGRVFRYKLAAVPAKENQEALPVRYALVFVDPDTGNTYDVKLMPGGEKTLNQRTFAILRLMGTKVANSKHAEAMMAGLFAIRNPLDPAVEDHDEPLKVQVVQVDKGKNRMEPATTYIADHVSALRLVMTADEDGYVTEFRIHNIR
jgi:hypothetical protein